MTQAFEQKAFSSLGSAKPAHRVDIDGLRALAVMAVVLFHADLLKGGFVGVDIFFVISGYLMASIVMYGLEEGRFSLIEFYARRIRRIIPALAVVMALIAIAGSLFMLPHDIKELGRSIVAASTFTSNLWFRDIAADYFAAENVLYQPMLHSWSLAVEAQFYLVFPLLMMASHRWLGRRSVYVLCALALASLAYSSFAVINDPQGAFYLLVSRMWELLTGAVIFFLPQMKRFRVAVALAGLGMIAISLVLYHPAIGFPGWKALLPVIGAMMVLYARPGMDGGRIHNLLASEPVAFLGKTSYSLYLWHWPLFVFARYNIGPVLPVWLDICLIGAAICLAWLSWGWVEQPFLRDARKLSAWRKLAVPMAMLLVLVVLGSIVKNIVPKYSHGLLPPAVTALAEAERDYIKGDCMPPLGDELPCRFGHAEAEVSILVWGNSFARMWMPGLDKIARENMVAGRAAILSACPPFGEAEDTDDCARFNESVLDYIVAASGIETIILAADWDIDENFAPALEALVARLHEAGKTVYFVLRPPHPAFAVPRALAIAALREEPAPAGVLYKKHDKERQPYMDILHPLMDRYDLRLIDPADSLCYDGMCPVQAPDGTVLYYDSAHITQSGAIMYRNLYSPVFQR